MTARGLGTVTALVNLPGWAVVPVALVLTGKVNNAPPGSYDEAWEAPSHQGAGRFLRFVHGLDSGWVLVHVFFMTGAVAITHRPAFFWSALSPQDALAMPALVRATFGGLLLLFLGITQIVGTRLFGQRGSGGATPRAPERSPAA